LNNHTASNIPTDNVPHINNRGSNQSSQPKWSRGSHHPRGSRDQFKRPSHMIGGSPQNDNNIQRGRVMKERHKGSHANHNRKDRAQQKMCKGML